MDARKSKILGGPCFALAQSLHSPPGAGPMLGRLVAGAGAGSEPASEPEPLPAAGRAAPEHCCRGDRSSGYWVPALTFQVFFYGRDFVSWLANFTNCSRCVVHRRLVFRSPSAWRSLRRVRDLNYFASFVQRLLRILENINP